MRLAISEQALVFFWSALLGAGYGIGFDLLRLFRLKIGKRKGIGLLADAVYALVSCFVLLGFVLTVANGQMRWYVLFGIFLGGMLYASAFSPTVFRVLVVLARWVSRLLNAIGKPFEWFLHGSYRLILKLRNGHRKRKTKRTQKGEVLWQQEEKSALGSSHG